MVQRFKRFLLSGNILFFLFVFILRIYSLFHKRYPAREDVEDGIETGGDVDAMLCYHRIGTPQCSSNIPSLCSDANVARTTAKDILIHSDNENPEQMWSVGISDDGKYLFLYSSKDTSLVRDSALPGSKINVSYLLYDTEEPLVDRRPSRERNRGQHEMEKNNKRI